MSLFRFPVRVRVALEVLSVKYMNPGMFTPGFQLSPAGPAMPSAEDVSSNSLSNLINGAWLMAAPKSKVYFDFSTLFSNKFLTSTPTCTAFIHHRSQI